MPPIGVLLVALVGKVEGDSWKKPGGLVICRGNPSISLPYGCRPVLRSCSPAVLRSKPAFGKHGESATYLAASVRANVMLWVARPLCAASTC